MLITANIRKTSAALLFFLLSGLQHCHAIPENWQETPRSPVGYLRLLNGILYAVTTDGNVSFKTSGSEEWSFIEGIKIDNDYKILALESHDNFLYAGTNGGIFKINCRAAETKQVLPVTAAAAPEKPISEEQASKEKIEANKLLQWEQAGLADKSIVVLYAYKGYLYAVTNKGEIYKSSPRQETWEQDKTVLANMRLRSLIGYGNDLYAGTDKGIFKTAIGQDNWQQINCEVLKGKDIWSFYACPSNSLQNPLDQLEQKNNLGSKCSGSCSGFLYAVTSGGEVYGTHNQGKD